MLLLFIFTETRFILRDSRFVILFNMLILACFFKSFYKGKRSTRSNLLVIGSPERNKSIASLLRRSSVYAADQRMIQSPEALPCNPELLTRTVLELMESKGCSGAIILFDETHYFNCVAESSIKLDDSGISSEEPG